jgi:hypothetical protein
MAETPRKLKLRYLSPFCLDSTGRKDGCSTHKLHTISFKTITNLPTKVKKANVRKKFKAAKIRKQSFTD